MEDLVFWFVALVVYSVPVAGAWSCMRKREAR